MGNGHDNVIKSNSRITVGENGQRERDAERKVKSRDLPQDKTNSQLESKNMLTVVLKSFSLPDGLNLRLFSSNNGGWVI